MSRAAAIRYCQNKQEKQSVIISISDPNMIYTSQPFCSQENRVTAILPLTFCDADRPGKDVYGKETAVSGLMGETDAQRIAIFVRTHRDKRIIVHCDAGISRSSGVAAAIAKHYDGDDSEYFYSGQFCPNMWCYRKTLTALAENDKGV